MGSPLNIYVYLLRLQHLYFDAVKINAQAPERDPGVDDMVGCQRYGPFRGPVVVRPHSPQKQGP